MDALPSVTYVGLLPVKTTAKWSLTVRIIAALDILLPVYQKLTCARYVPFVGICGGPQ